MTDRPTRCWRRLGKLAPGIFVLSLLAACDENGNFQMPAFGGETESGSENAATSAASTTSTVVERDVEAPEVFAVSENGLWDGRPSLGGVWVAHPDVTDPERVIIRNQDNGQFVIGALFRRERDNPGPSLQVSSDAAEELGMLAGSPSRLSVVALRREEGPAETTVVETTEFAAAPEISAAPLEAGPEIATAPIDADLPTATAASTIASVAAGAGTEEPSATPGATEDVTINAAAAIAAVEAAMSGGSTAPAAATPAPTASPLAKPFVQVGIFSVESNATSTAERLRADGLSTRVLSQESQGKRFWRVIVGPAPTSADRAAVLDKVKALGFGDAYFVTN